MTADGPSALRLLTGEARGASWPPGHVPARRSTAAARWLTGIVAWIM
ncbi:MAG TPA: hypothetical protein VME44_07325 [Streptosporangiaceae bacterium]|nr:hypothetical protein [Streptosporangiaceae bacterium]